MDYLIGYLKENVQQSELKILKYSHWELLLAIYQHQKTPFKMLSIQAHKTLLRTCIKQGWVKELEDTTLFVTTNGINSAKDIAPLYKRGTSPQMGQTF
jgi:hypothetical protein